MWRSSSFCFVSGSQVAVVRNALVVIVRDEVENVLFQIRAGAADGVNFVLPDHLGKRKPNSAVLIAPASVRNILPPLLR